MQHAEKQLRHELSNFGVLSQENDKLHNTLKKLTIQVQSKRARCESERERKTQKNFDFGITMESILRKEVKALFENYQTTAVAEMDMEATDAWKENKLLLIELQRRIDASLELLVNHQKSYEILKQVRIREEVQRQDCKMKEETAKSLSNYTEKQER